MSKIYQQLCPVCFGAGAISEIGQKAREFGAKKVFCIYDQGVKTSGIAERVIGYLKAAGMNVDSFDGVIADTPDILVNEVGAQLYGQDYDLVVGIGGGSSMDTAKAASVLADYPLPIERYFASNGGNAFLNNKTKLILIPTSSGTGSEVTIMSVVHNTEKNVKDAVLHPADLAIVDPELTMSVPPSVTASSGLDAFSHALEAFTSVNCNPKDDLLALHAIGLIANNLEAAYQDGTNLSARTALSFASNIAGIAFSDASVHVGHCAAHEMGLKLHMPHGVACALATPEVIEFCADVLPEKICKIAEILGVQIPADAVPAQVGKLAADAVRTLMRRVGIKPLREQGHSREAVLDCARGAIGNNWFHIMSPKPVNTDIMRTLLEKIYDNY